MTRPDTDARARGRPGFGNPGAYRIRVRGQLSESWSVRFGDMRVTVSGHVESEPVTILEGEVRDQAELMGILSNLHHLHLPLLSVELL